MGIQPFKFRHVNKISGAFVFMGLAILIALVSLAGRAQQWFVPSTEYRVVFDKVGGTMGIQKGSDVRVFGNHVGHVQRVELVETDDLSPVRSFDGLGPGDLYIVAVLSVKGEFTNFIGADSVAVLKYDLGGLGSAYFDISRGTEKRDPRGDDFLEIAVEEDVKKKMEGMLTDFQTTARNTLVSITATSDSTKEFVEKLARDDGDLFASIDRLESNLAALNRIITNIEGGEGAIGKLLVNQETEERVDRFIGSLGDASDELQPMVANLNQTIEHLDLRISEIRQGINSFNEASEMLVGTVGATDETIAGFGVAAEQLSEMLRESEVLVEGLQRHWLVRRFIRDPVEDPAGNRLTTGEASPSDGSAAAPATTSPPATPVSDRPSDPKPRTGYRGIGKKR